MAIQETPLYGNVQIKRLTDVWVEKRRNLVVNPQALAWTADAGTGGVALMASVTGFNGAPARKMTWATAPTGGNPRIRGITSVSLSPGQSLAVSADVASSRSFAVIQVDFLTSAGVFIETRRSPARSDISTDVANPTRILWETGPAPANTARVTFYIRWSGGLPLVGDWISGSRFFVGDSESYFDGSSNPNGATERTRWLGTPNASISVLETNRVDFIENATNLSIRRGGVRDGLGVKTDVGLMTFTLHNDEDPLAGGTIAPGQSIQAVVTKRNDYPAETLEFESFENGLPSSWGRSTDYTNLSIGTGGLSGTSTLQLQTDLTSGYVMTHVVSHTLTGLSPGREHRISAWIKRSSTLTSTYRISVLNGGTGPSVKSTAGWVEVSHTFTPTKTSADMFIQVASSANGPLAVIDSVAIFRNAYSETTSRPIFTGRVAHISSNYPMDKNTGKTRASVTVTVADAVQIHGSTMRYGVDLGTATNETFEARIQRLEGSANAPVAVPSVGAPIVRYSL